MLEPTLFDTYIAFDSSLWWNNAGLIAEAKQRFAAGDYRGKVLYFANSSEPELAELAQRFNALLETSAPAGLDWHYDRMPAETHGTIYHPAALSAFRRVFKPAK